MVDSSGKNDSQWTLVGVDTMPLELEISGGRGIDIAFTNPVDEEMTEWDFSVDITGLVLPNRITNVYTTIPGGHTLVSSLSVFGIGLGSLDVSVENVSDSVYFLIIGPFVKVLGG